MVRASTLRTVIVIDAGRSRTGLAGAEQEAMQKIARPSRPVAETGIKEKKDLTKAIDELQRRMKVVPQEVLYVPKFTYVWTLAEARFPKEMAVKIPRDEAVHKLARTYLNMCGMTLLGDLSRKFGFYRWESGRANHQLVNERFAKRLGTGIYRLASI